MFRVRKKSLKFGPRLIASVFILLLLILVHLVLNLHLDIHGSFVQCWIGNNSNISKVFISRDKFKDLEYYLKLERDIHHPGPHEDVIIRSQVYHYNPSLAELLNHTIKETESSLERFQWRMQRHNVYRENDAVVRELLNDISILPVVDARTKDGGTQLKLEIEFPGNIVTLFKPMRFPRDQQTKENHFFFSDFERHHAEIASYHLDMIMGFRRTMPVVGRVLNVTRDILPFVDAKLRRTFYKSPVNNTCFFGQCMYYCDFLYPVCGKGELLEGSFAAFLPNFDETELKHYISPWKRIYAPNKIAEWETKVNYCTEVKRNFTNYQDKYRILLDVMDLAIFDFLIQNGDRHSFTYMSTFGTDSAPIVLDNGRGFGNAFKEDYLILAPLIDCCHIRESTLKTLLKFHNGPKRLSQLMRESLAKDPLVPVLWEPHYSALDRRVELILFEIRKCIEKKKNEREMVLKALQIALNSFTK